MCQWLLEVNGNPIHSLDTLLDVVTSIPDREYVRLRFQDVFSGAKKVLTMKTDLLFFPTQRLSLNERFEWDRRTFTTPTSPSRAPAAAQPPLSPVARLCPQAFPSCDAPLPFMRRWRLLRRFPVLTTQAATRWGAFGLGAAVAAAVTAVYFTRSSVPRVTKR